MQVKLSAQKGFSVISASGNIDDASAAILKAGLTKILRSGKNRMVVDLSAATQVSPLSFKEISALNRLARELQGEIVVLAPDAKLRAGFEEFNPAHDVKVLTDLTSALASLSAGAPDAAPGSVPATVQGAAAPKAPAAVPASAQAPAAVSASAQVPASAGAPAKASAASPAAAAGKAAVGKPIAGATKPAPASFSTQVVGDSAKGAAAAGVKLTGEAAAHEHDLLKEIGALKERLRALEGGEIEKLRKDYSTLKLENDRLHEQFQNLVFERRVTGTDAAYRERLDILEKQLEEAMTAAPAKK